MQSPLVSIIVPVYNVAAWLPRCLDSICAQTYEPLEIICVNDEQAGEYACQSAVELLT